MQKKTAYTILSLVSILAITVTSLLLYLAISGKL